MLLNVYVIDSSKYRDWPIMDTIQFLMIIQQLTHFPFTYYISKESFLSAIDEMQTRSLSQMVDRLRMGINGDPRHFLAKV